MTVAPVFSITPAISYPGIAGNLMFRNCANFSERAAESTGFTPAAITFTKISFSFGTGRGTSSSFNTSGPPYS